MTPHLGASTSEAQENVAVQIADQIADYLISGAVSNALNMPSISADEAPRLKPYIALAEQLGSFAGQLTDSRFTAITIEYAGDVGEMNTRASDLGAARRPAQPDARQRQYGLGAGRCARARHPGRRDPADPSWRL